MTNLHISRAREGERVREAERLREIADRVGAQAKDELEDAVQRKRLLVQQLQLVPAPILVLAIAQMQLLRQHNWCSSCAIFVSMRHGGGTE